jgi:hypothetical protein
MQKERCRNGIYPSILGDIRNDHSNSMFVNHRAVNASLKPVAIGTDSRTPLNYQILKLQGICDLGSIQGTWESIYGY